MSIKDALSLSKIRLSLSGLDLHDLILLGNFNARRQLELRSLLLARHNFMKGELRISLEIMAARVLELHHVVGVVHVCIECRA